MTVKRFYIDLDRTVFRTDQSALVLEKCSELFPQFADTGADYMQFYHYLDNGWRYYDFGLHLESVGLDRWEVYRALAATELADGRMEYEGLAELVASLQAKGKLAVLTFGEDSYQRFKVSLCPSLAGVEVITTLGMKRDHMDTETENWLIDDTPNALPEGTHFIQAAMEHEVKSAKHEGEWPILRSLDQVKEYVNETVH